MKDLTDLTLKLNALDNKMEKVAEIFRAEIEKVHEQQRSSAMNMVHYLTLRCEDIRQIQDKLHEFGLSSLASSESHIRRQIQEVRSWVDKEKRDEMFSPIDYHFAQERIASSTQRLFGQAKVGVPNIMVTLDTKMANKLERVKKLMKAGMNTARINCAHDSIDEWQKMLDVVKDARTSTGCECKIYMDLAGPKMRTILLGEGRETNKLLLAESQELIFAESDAEFDQNAAVIGCQQADVVDQVNVGDRILFDDGVIEAVVSSKGKGLAFLKVKRISTKKSWLKSQKGINLPDTHLTLPPLTSFDAETLPFICENADMIGYSFVRDADDVRQLQDLIKQQPKKPHIILKIETSEAVSDLPALLLQGMQEEIFGVMIARGDLAVEIGFERLSEIQEEILWICEAAHVPVIWATQVLEKLNKRGIASRAEVTDAFQAVMAECVLLNKGEYIFRVIKTLRDILSRSATHRSKKRYTLRPMQIAVRFLNAYSMNRN